jgi:plastocyanin
MRKRKLLIALAGLALVAASCGDDDDSGGQGTTAPAATPAATTGTSAATGTSTPTGAYGGGGTTEPEEETEGTTAGSAPVSLEGTLNNKGTEEASDEVEMELDDYYFEPTFIKAQPGATIHVKLENEGDDTHTFTIDSLGIDQEVAAGEDAEVDVTLPQEGAVRFYCRFHGNMGMQGAFFFNEGDTVVTGTTGG